MNNKFNIRKILYRLGKPKRHHYYDELMKIQTQDMHELLCHQNKTSKKLVQNAYKNTTYYKVKYDQVGFGEKILAEDFELSQLPILTKSELRKYSNKMLVKGYNKNDLLSGKTSGSTGEPVKFYLDNNTIEKMHAAQWRFYTWCGWEPGEKILHFWGAKQDISSKLRLKSKFVEWLSGERFIGAYEFDDEKMHRWLDAIEIYKPVIIQGYATLLSEFAKYLSDNAINVRIKLKGIYSTAEVLYLDQRKLIEKVFDCKVYNQYGCREVPAIACECKQGNMHMFTDMAYVETTSNSTSDYCELIITSLSNDTMPIIRYKLGDLGKLKQGSCSCGSPFPLMEMGLCRTNDLIKLKDGRNIYPAYFNQLMQDINEIDEYQFHQTEFDKINLYIISTTKKNDSLIVRLNELEFKIATDLGMPVSLFIKIVNEIPKTKAGKFRFVVSDI